MSKKDNPYDLTEAEVAFLRGSTVAPEVRNYLARQHENLGTKTTSFQKVAAAANAEADAMLAVKRLDGVRGEAVEVAELQAAVESRDKQINGLSAVVDRQKAELLRVKSLPAQVVHSGGD